MDTMKIQAIFEIGETIAVEFKRCGNGIENDVYETVCSFLNRFGGDIFMGVLDDGTVLGVPEKAAPDMVKNFVSCISNPALHQQYTSRRRFYLMRERPLFTFMFFPVRKCTVSKGLFMIA